MSGVLDRPLRCWNTATVEPSQKFAYWVNTVCEELVELQIISERSKTFEASMTQKALGSVRLTFVSSSEAQRAWRTKEAICRSREARYDLLFVRSGTFVVEHYGQRFAVKPNECVLLDTTSPFYFEHTERVQATSLALPQKWLRSRLAVPEDSVAKVIGESSPWGRVLLSALGALNADSFEELAVPDQTISEGLGNLLTLAIGRTHPQVSTRQRKVLPQMRQILADCACDHLLSPAKVAKACAISTRHLHSIFAAAGSTFSKELMAIRLDRGLRMLGDPSFANTNVADIAQRCGFTDSSHFARRFAERYGVAPRAYRRSPGRIDGGD